MLTGRSAPRGQRTGARSGSGCQLNHAWSYPGSAGGPPGELTFIDTRADRPSSRCPESQVLNSTMRLTLRQVSLVVVHEIVVDDVARSGDPYVGVSADVGQEPIERSDSVRLPDREG